MDQVDGRGSRGDGVRLQHDVVGVRLGPRAEPAHHAHDGRARLGAGDPGADRVHGARDVPAEPEEPAGPEGLGSEQAGPYGEVGGVDPGRGDPHPHLAGPRLGQRHLGDLQHLGPAEFPDHDSAHGNDSLFLRTAAVRSRHTPT